MCDAKVSGKVQNELDRLQIGVLAPADVPATTEAHDYYSGDPTRGPSQTVLVRFCVPYPAL